MGKFEELLDFINELNENGRILYDDYSHLFDLASELGEAENALGAAKVDIAALLWLNGTANTANTGRKRNSAARTGGIVSLETA